MERTIAGLKQADYLLVHPQPGRDTLWGVNLGAAEREVVMPLKQMGP
jgi:hypothetical protein